MKRLLRILAMGLAATLLLIGCRTVAQATVTEPALPAGGWLALLGCKKY